MPYPISQSTATEAYAQAAKTVTEARERALLYTRLANTMDGVYITCKIADKAAQVFPSYNVRYYRYESGCKALILTRKEGGGKYIALDIACKDDRYLTSAAMLKRAEYERGQANKYQAALDNFWEYLGQYNVLVGELAKVRDQISTVMYCCRYLRDF